MRIGLIGMGKMGKAITQVVSEGPHQIVAEFEIDKPMTGEAILECDALIDFSFAGALDKNLKIALEMKVPFVTGTTGWYDKMESYKEKVKMGNGSFLYASNFSIGVLLFHKLLTRAAELYNPFSQYDFALHEVHHNQKADSPSGTAITLANEVLKKLDSKNSLQIGNPDAKIAADKLQISSSRVGSVAGIHSLFIESGQDSIELTHKANGRIGFASGAVKAAEWLVGKKGFYTMDDMINSLITE